ncbi:MAG: EAL domain-containing protein [Microthrixaceae bacterium]
MAVDLAVDSGPDPVDPDAELSLLRRAVERSADAISVFTAIRDGAGAVVDFRVAVTNEIAARMVGRNLEEMLGRPISELFPESTPWLLELWTSALERDASLVEEMELHDLDGAPFWMRQQVVPLGDAVAVTSHDITDRVLAERELERRAFRDALTGLPNRSHVESVIDAALAEDPAQVAVLFIDLDHFKAVNDTLGHPAGDVVLREAAGRMRACLRDDDVLARFGGDEFVVCCRGPGVAEDRSAVVSRILRCMAEPFRTNGRTVSVTASIGVAVGRPGVDCHDLIRDADAATYRAKEGGRNRVAQFDEALRSDLLAELGLGERLRAALTEAQLRPAFRAVVAPRTGRPVAIEVEVEWLDGIGRSEPGRGHARLVDRADAAGAWAPVGRWLRGEAAAALAALDRAGAVGLVAWTPLARGELTDDLPDELLEAADRAGVPVGRLGLEVTEDCLRSALDTDSAVLRQLRQLGVRLGLRDFGEGGLPLRHLHPRLVERVKVGVTAGGAGTGLMTGSAVVPAAVAAAATLAGHVGLDLVGDLVHTDRQADVAARLGCSGVIGEVGGGVLGLDLLVPTVVDRLRNVPADAPAARSGRALAGVLALEGASGRVGRPGGVDRPAGPAPEAPAAPSADLRDEVLRHSSDAALVLHPDHGVLYASPACSAVLGLSPVSLVGRLAADWVHPDDVRLALAGREEAASTGQAGPVELRGLHADGSHRWFEAEWWRVDERDDGRVVLHLRDVSDRRAAREALRRRATVDDLTGLANRSGFLERTVSMAVAARTIRSAAVLVLDIDHFGPLNDALGHEDGDRVLVELAHRLEEVLSGDGVDHVVARLGGDQFAVALAVGNDRVDPDPVAVAERLRSAAARPFLVSGVEHRLTVSVGLTPAGSLTDVAGCLRDAGAALHAAKSSGRDRTSVFEPAIRAVLLDRLEVQRGLDRAIEENELVLHFQPAYDTSSGSATSVEALVRWDHPERGLLGPAHFIDVAERSGQIVALGNWVMERAARTAVALGFDRPGRRRTMWVNLSARQLVSADIVGSVRSILDRVGLDAHHLGLEITESMWMQTDPVYQHHLLLLHQLGCPLAIDDFGTGYSSLSYLRRYPVDVVKLDRSFVAGLGDDADATAIAEAVTALGRSLDLRVIAEGVETVSQLDRLVEMGCTAVSGFGLCRPLPAPDLGALLDEPLVQRRARLVERRG